MHRILDIRSLVVRSICVFSILSAIPVAAAAASFILISADRFVEEGTSVCELCDPPTEFSSNSSESSNEFGFFSEFVSGIGSEAEQNSTLRPNLLMGDGRVDTGFSGDNSATSFLSVVFQVDATDQYSLSGQLFNIVDENRITLTSAMSGIIFNRDSPGGGLFVENFTLELGETYTLVAVSSGSGFGTPDFGQWEFTMVPEPSTGMLVLLGLTGIAARRRGRA